MYRTKFITLPAIFMLGFSASACQQEENHDNQIVDLAADDDQVQEQHQDILDSPEEQLMQAVMTNNVGQVKHLLETYSAFDYMPAFSQAIKKGYKKIVPLFLKTKKVDVNYCSGKGFLGNIPLCIAIDENHMEIVRLLINAGADVNKRSKGGASPLYIAAMRNAFDMVKLLVDLGIQVKGATWARYSPLIAAATNGNIDMLQYFFDHGFRVSISKEAYPAAHAAAATGKLDVLKYLLQQNSDLATYASGRGETPVHLAARQGYLDCVRMLVEEYNASVDVLTNNDYTPLMCAAKNGCVDVARYLMSKGARLDQRSRQGKLTALDFAQRYKSAAAADLLSWVAEQQEDEAIPEEVESVEVRDQLDRESAQEAADAIMLLVPHDDPTVVNSSAVEHALSTSSVSIRACEQAHGVLAVREEFMQKIEAGDIVHVVGMLERSRALAQLEDARGYIPLHHAARHGKFPIFRLLLNLGASVHSKDADDYTTLHHAIFGGSKSLVNFLIQKKLPFLVEAKDGKTAFDLAVEQGYQEIVALFLEKLNGSDKMLFLNRPAKHGVLPLHVAARKGFDGIVRVLIENGARVSSYDLGGSTPLHYAVAGGHIEVVRVLLSAGAVVQLQDINRQTALDVAKRDNKQEILDCLQCSGRDEDEPATKRQKTR